MCNKFNKILVNIGRGIIGKCNIYDADSSWILPGLSGLVTRVGGISLVVGGGSVVTGPDLGTIKIVLFKL